jgi:hypothetical protein
VIVKSEKVLSSKPILSAPFEKSVIISATFMSVLASETLQTNISAPPLPVSISFTPAPEPPYRVFAELFPVILSDAELAKSSIRDLSNTLINFSKEIVNNQIELFKARAQELAIQTNTLLNEKDKFRKQGEVLKSKKKCFMELKKLVKEEIDEIFPLVKEGIIGKSEKFRLERESAKLDSEIAVNKNKQEQNNFAIEKNRELNKSHRTAEFERAI